MGTSVSCKPQPEIILENHYGSHQPCVFCEHYEADLEEQGFAEEVDLIVKSDHMTNVLYYDDDRSELEGVDLATLTERASCAWMDILDKFVPQEGYHLGYMPDDQALWMLPDGYDPEFPEDWNDPDDCEDD